MVAGKERWVTLQKPVIIYVHYLNAFVDRAGQAHFRQDVYGRDRGPVRGGSTF